MGIRGAFEYLHGRTPPVVYRDFKPGNVIQVDDNGQKRQVLIDLGTAMEYFPGQKREAWGTVGFAPPEIGGICEQSPTMDLFAIVSTLAALLGVDVNTQLSRRAVPPRLACLARDLRLRFAWPRPRPSRALPDGDRAFRPIGGYPALHTWPGAGKSSGKHTDGRAHHKSSLRRAGARTEHNNNRQAIKQCYGQDRRVPRPQQRRPCRPGIAARPRPDGGGPLQRGAHADRCRPQDLSGQHRRPSPARRRPQQYGAW